jgi:hypothetical protein
VGLFQIDSSASLQDCSVVTAIRDAPQFTPGCKESLSKTHLSDPKTGICSKDDGMTVQFVAGRNLIHSLATKPMPLIACSLLGTWFILCLAVFSGRPGDDLSPLYFAARFIADGRIDHVFSHDPLFFHMVNDPVWTAEAARTSFTGHAHPFVQAPIWAWMVSPLAMNLSFPEFNALFLVVNIAGAIGALALAIMAWHPRLLAPIPLAALITLVSLSQPFRYNLFLNQTQSLVFFLTMLAILLVQRRRPAAAGAALAFASLIKILPVALAIYWFITGGSGVDWHLSDRFGGAELGRPRPRSQR